MKKIVTLVLALVMVLSVVACSSSASKETATASNVMHVVYGFPGTAARLNYVNNDGSYAGYEIDIINELDKRLEDVEFELYCAGEFSALTPGLDAGKFGMVGSNISWKQERADNYLYSDVAYIHTPYAMAVRPDEETIHGIEDLAGHHLTVIPGTAGTLFMEKFNEEHPDNPIDLEYIESNSIDSIAMLLDGRTDATFCNVSDYAIAEEERGYQVKIISIDEPDLVQSPDGFFLFPKGADELKAKVDKCLTEMREDGTLTELCLKYFSLDFSDLTESWGK